MRERWLYGFLYRLLLIWYVGVVCGLLAAAATWPRRPIASLAEVPWWSQVVALVVVAATWAPVSAWLRRGVHHLVFGQRDNTYEVAARVYEQLRGDPDPAELLPTLAATLARTLTLPYVAIRADGHTVAAHGEPPAGAEVVSIPLRYHHLTLGALTVSGRSGVDRLSTADLRLLDDLARHVGITLHAARLSAAVQASREQLVAAREEERRRIRRDLHDGLGPTLASLRLQLTAVHRTMTTDPGAADAIVRDLLTDLGAATAEVRRLVDDLRPPMLDEFGLVDALRNLRADDGLRRSVHAPEPLPPLPAATEVALYRIAAEALHNAVRHASAGHCAIDLAATAAGVTLTVTDDGRGLPAGYLAGVGHRSMRERAAELGGTVVVGSGPSGHGTRVSATFPLKPAGSPDV